MAEPTETATETAATAATALGGGAAPDPAPGPDPASKSAAPAATALGGGSETDWRTGLGELADHPSLKDYKDLGALAKSHVDLQRMLGENRLKVPGEDAAEEDIAKFFNALGRPETPDGYELKAPDNLPEGMAVPEAATAAFRAKAHELGLTAKQAQDLYDWSHSVGAEAAGQTTAERAKAFEDGRAALHAEWARAGKSPDAMLHHARTAVRTFGGKPLMSWMDTTGAGDDPTFQRFFAAVGEAMSEHPLVTGQGAGAASAKSAQAEIDRLGGDREYLADLRGDNGDARRKAAKERWKTLNDQAAMA